MLTCRYPHCLPAQDIDGDGKPEYAFCIPLMRDAREAQVANMFQGILASMTVYDGQQQGYMFEPLTLEPLVGGHNCHKPCGFGGCAMNGATSLPFGGAIEHASISDAMGFDY